VLNRAKSTNVVRKAEVFASLKSLDDGDRMNSHSKAYKNEDEFHCRSVSV
jgi:hypothetical protein